MLAESQKTLAIVLKSVRYEERHKMITALTEQHGQISVLAKNSVHSRRFAGTLDPFVASEWVFQIKPGAEIGILTETYLKEAFEGLRNEFRRLSLASVFSELMLRLAPVHQPCIELFKLHSNALATLNEGIGNEVSLLNAYLAKLLQWSGSQPQLQNCLYCKIPLHSVNPNEELSCIITSAGWACSQCRQKATQHLHDRQGRGLHHSLIRILPVTISDFLLSLKIPIRKIPFQIQASEAQHHELFKFLEGLFAFHMPGFDQKPLKSLKFVGLSSTLLSSHSNSA